MVRWRTDIVPNDPLKKQLGENPERFPIEQDLKPPVSHTEKYAWGLFWTNNHPLVVQARLGLSFFFLNE